MIDVNEWEWTSPKAHEAYTRGASLCKAAVMSVEVGAGLNDPAVRARELASLRDSISSLRSALDLEECPIPLPYAYLTCSHAILAAFLSFGEEEYGKEALAHCREAVAASELAEERYGRTSGWSLPARHEYQVCLAMVHLNLREIQASREALDVAQKYQVEGALLVALAKGMRRTLDNIDRTSEAAGKPSRRKGGCLGVVAVGLMILVGCMVWYLLG